MSQIPINVFSESQWKAIIWAGRCSGTLSVIGSGIIVFMIMRDFRKKTGHPRNRILLVMSLIDILSSISWAVSTAAAPKGTVIYGAKGNDKTCAVQGFFVTFGLAVPAYNAMLCLYYLSAIRYKMNKKVFAKKYEFWMHSLAVLVSLGSAITGVVLDLFHTSITVCWIVQECEPNFSEGEWRAKCIDDPDTDGIIMGMQIFAMIMSVIYFVIIMSSVVGIFLAVRKPTQNIRRYEFGQQQRRNERRGSFSGFNREEDRETAKQAFLFVLAYLVTYFAPFLNIIFQREVSFELNLLLCMLTPLQGFWNFVIYLRPRLYEVRKRNYENKNVFWILKTAIMTKDLGPSTQGTRRRSSGNISQRRNSRGSSGNISVGRLSFLDDRRRPSVANDTGRHSILGNRRRSSGDSATIRRSSLPCNLRRPSADNDTGRHSLSTCLNKTNNEESTTEISHRTVLANGPDLESGQAEDSQIPTSNTVKRRHSLPSRLNSANIRTLPKGLIETVSRLFPEPGSTQGD